MVCYGARQSVQWLYHQVLKVQNFICFLSVFNLQPYKCMHKSSPNALALCRYLHTLCPHPTYDWCPYYLPLMTAPYTLCLNSLPLATVPIFGITDFHYLFYRHGWKYYRSVVGLQSRALTTYSEADKQVRVKVVDSTDTHSKQASSTIPPTKRRQAHRPRSIAADCNTISSKKPIILLYSPIRPSPPSQCGGLGGRVLLDGEKRPLCSPSPTTV